MTVANLPRLVGWLDAAAAALLLLASCMLADTWLLHVHRMLPWIALYLQDL